MAVELVGTLDGQVGVVDKTKAYLVDFSKMNSVNDLMLVLSSFGFTIAGDHPFIDQLKPFLNLEKPIDLNPQPQQQEPQFIPLKED